jgi:hypothetical protein
MAVIEATIQAEKKLSFEAAEYQIRENQKKVDFDVKEYTIEYYVDKFKTGEFFIPEYQRDFVWDEKRQAKFIESVVLGLPVPFIFVADVYGRDDKDDESDDGNLEIVDGSQRIRTLTSFVDNELQLNGLEVLDELNNLYFRDFSAPRQKRFKNSTIRMIQISDKSDADVRFMMFERINTGSDELKAMEQRKGIYRGKFMDFIYECAKNPLFIKLTRFTDKMKKRGEAEELILRFFAYSESYLNFKYSVIDFLNNYIKEKNETDFDKAILTAKFEQMLTFVDAHFPNGFLRKPDVNKTPRIRFEAISVGVILALEVNPNLQPKSMEWLDSDAFISEISGGSSINTSIKVKSRIEFVKNKLLGRRINSDKNKLLGQK